MATLFEDDDYSDYSIIDRIAMCDLSHNAERLPGFNGLYYGGRFDVSGILRRHIDRALQRKHNFGVYKRALGEDFGQIRGFVENVQIDGSQIEESTGAISWYQHSGLGRNVYSVWGDLHRDRLLNHLQRKERGNSTRDHAGCGATQAAKSNHFWADGIAGWSFPTFALRRRDLRSANIDVRLVLQR